MSSYSKALAEQLRQFYFGGNWTHSTFQDQLADVSWQEAVTDLPGLNSILKLSYHIHYYVQVAIPVLRGGQLDAHDDRSFDHPSISSTEDWEAYKEQIWQEATQFCDLLASLPDDRLWEDFTDSRYGSYYRNLNGTVEHAHYHLGQLVLIKGLIRSQ